MKMRNIKGKQSHNNKAVVWMTDKNDQIQSSIWYEGKEEEKGLNESSESSSHVYPLYMTQGGS